MNETHNYLQSGFWENSVRWGPHFYALYLGDSPRAMIDELGRTTVCFEPTANEVDVFPELEGVTRIVIQEGDAKVAGRWSARIQQYGFAIYTREPKSKRPPRKLTTYFTHADEAQECLATMRTCPATFERCAPSGNAWVANAQYPTCPVALGTTEADEVGGSLLAKAPRFETFSAASAWVRSQMPDESMQLIDNVAESIYRAQGGKFG